MIYLFIYHDLFFFKAVIIHFDFMASSSTDAIPEINNNETKTDSDFNEPLKITKLPSLNSNASACR